MGNRGSHYRPLVPGLPNARRCAPGLLAAMAALYDDAHALTHEQAIAEYDRIAIEDDARRSAQRALPLRGGE
ncbi:hypothetical protein MMG85_11885 [Pseudoxanthomonas sp. LH2527]|nr:hypothetical protein [Pseudoxanthomonas sp. LH2527]